MPEPKDGASPVSAARETDQNRSRSRKPLVGTGLKIEFAQSLRDLVDTTGRKQVEIAKAAHVSTASVSKLLGAQRTSWEIASSVLKQCGVVEGSDLKDWHHRWESAFWRGDIHANLGAGRAEPDTETGTELLLQGPASLQDATRSQVKHKLSELQPPLRVGDLTDWDLMTPPSEQAEWAERIRSIYAYEQRIQSGLIEAQGKEGGRWLRVRLVEADLIALLKAAFHKHRALSIAAVVMTFLAGLAFWILAVHLLLGW